MTGWGMLAALLFAVPAGARTRAAAPVIQTAPNAPAVLPASLPAPSISALASGVASGAPILSPAPALPAPVSAAAAPAKASAASASARASAGRVSVSAAPTRGPPAAAQPGAALEQARAWARRPGEPLNVLMVGAESVPYAKTGGLADVVDAVSRGLAERGHRVTLILPKYRQIDADKHGFKRTDIVVDVPMDGRVEKARLWAGRRDGVDVYLLDNDALHSPDGYYAPRKPGYSDDDERFIFLSRGALEAAKALGFKPDVVHAHDWHSALIAPMLKLLYKADPFFAATRSVLTLHNMAYQGMFPREVALKAGFDPKDFTYDKLEYWGRFNFLKAGLAFADALTTVSRTYAREIRESNEFGRGMEGLLSYRAADLSGILNGIDPALWDPATDGHIAARYLARNVSGGKAIDKAALQKETGLAVDPKAPLFTVASRFDPQKGLDLVADAIDGLVAKGAQIVVAGSGDKALTERFQELARRYPGRVALWGYDESFVHRLYAGADFVLMPSRFEPCGLTQLISQRYGTLPIVARTGGLADTVTDIDEQPARGDGFFLRELSASAILAAADRAIELQRDASALRRSRRIAMAKDSSWANAIAQYERLFLRLLGR